MKKSPTGSLTKLSKMKIVEIKMSAGQRRTNLAIKVGRRKKREILNR